MGIMGLPRPEEISSMMGFVTDEDRAKWDQAKARSDAELAQRRGADSVAGQAVNPALGFAEKSITAQMHGEQMAERERMRESDEEEIEVVETRRRRKRVPYLGEDAKPKGGSDFQMGG